jgi:hypothetical protein
MKTINLKIFLRNLCIFLISFYSYSNPNPNVAAKEFKRVFKMKSIEEKCNYFYKKGFMKEINNTNEEVKLSMKIFNKKKQEYDEEIIIISKDTIKYFLNNPQKYMTFRVFLKHFDITKNESNQIVHKNGLEVFTEIESDEIRKYSETPVKFFIFSYSRLSK